jgi:glutamate 5-kinase
MIIANGLKADILIKLLSGENEGTVFIPAKEKLSSRKCWIGYNIKPKGILRIDEGAVSAILKRGKSLLPGGVIAVEGDFEVGDAVALSGESNAQIAIGLVNYSSSDIKKIMGCKTDQIHECLGEKQCDEVIHRDNLTVLKECRL